jgi:DNA modification methylase
MPMHKQNLKIEYVSIDILVVNDKNPRKWTKEQKDALKESITKFGTVDPILVNAHKDRTNIVIGGHFRLEVCKELGYKEVPVVFLNLTSEKETELNIRLNKNLGEWNFDLLAEFDESLLSEVGFSSEEIDAIFPEDEKTEQFDLQKELKKLNIQNISVQKGDIYELGGSRLMCGDSTIPEDFQKLMGEEKADMVFTDPPYLLDYLKGKTKAKDGVTTGFGAKKNRRYLETDVLPDNFTELWMSNAKDAVKTDSHIIVYENWKNIRTIWSEMEKYWKVKNMIVWHLPNRNQGFAGKYKFFSKHDIAMVGTSHEEVVFNETPEEGILQNDYETALYAIQGKPHWESYGKGKKYCPTDFIEYNAADEKSSGQGIVFGTKPIEILIPYIKVLTKRDDLILEPFGGSGSTLIASIKMHRRCFLMEKSPVYAEVILRRWEKFTGKKPVKIN